MATSTRNRRSQKALWRFVLTCWKANLQGTMEYLASFITVALMAVLFAKGLQRYASGNTIVIRQ